LVGGREGKEKCLVLLIRSVSLWQVGLPTRLSMVPSAALRAERLANKNRKKKKKMIEKIEKREEKRKKEG
jgi:hypothetical protein